MTRSETMTVLAVLADLLAAAKGPAEGLEQRGFHGARAGRANVTPRGRKGPRAAPWEGLAGDGNGTPYGQAVPAADDERPYVMRAWHGAFAPQAAKPYAPRAATVPGNVSDYMSPAAVTGGFDDCGPVLAGDDLPVVSDVEAAVNEALEEDKRNAR